MNVPRKRRLPFRPVPRKPTVSIYVRTMPTEAAIRALMDEYRKKRDE